MLSQKWTETFKIKPGNRRRDDNFSVSVDTTDAPKCASATSFLTC